LVRELPCRRTLSNHSPFDFKTTKGTWGKKGEKKAAKCELDHAIGLPGRKRGKRAARLGEKKPRSNVALKSPITSNT